MAINREKVTEDFVKIPRSILCDQNLSIAERGMLCTLYSLKASWKCNNKGFKKILPDGNTKISTTLNSLIDKGYLMREQGRDKGKFTKGSLTIVNTITENQEDNLLSFEQNKKCKDDDLTDEELHKLYEEYGKDLVDAQIRKIEERHYKGLKNYGTIGKWCEEKQALLIKTKSKNKFCEFKQNEYDYEALEKEILAN